MKKKIVILGCGKIGKLVLCLLAQSKDYEITVAELSEKSFQHLFLEIPFLKNHENIKYTECDFQNENDLKKTLSKQDYVLSCAPFFCNKKIAKIAKEQQVHYLDLTEDVETTHNIKSLAVNSKTDFIPQCGLAPGFITIIAQNLMNQMDEVFDVKMRVGALPLCPNNRLKYNLTWSVDGLINEYCNPCESIVDGKLYNVQALEGYEHFEIDGSRYEAFNTSGGLGTFATEIIGKVKNMNYKSVRYEGHCEMMKTLLWDLKLKEDRINLKNIFEKSLPYTLDDVVIVFSVVSGILNGKLVEKVYSQKIRSKKIFGIHWGAIQVSTAASICAVLDMHCCGKMKKNGFIHQQDILFDEFIQNRFGQYFQME